MQRTRKQDGFSLVELLTVIAIIAILAAIIFPVMTAVKKEAKMTQCMTNLHGIAMALQLYQQDNRKYPDTLCGGVVTSGGAVVPLERTTGLAGLYPEYIKAIGGLHCPLSETKKTDAVLHLTDGGGTDIPVYAYSSYDAFCPGTATGATSASETVARRYWPRWVDEYAGTPLDVSPGMADSNDVKAYDYKRQLRFRKPGTDTVVTWCSYHRDDSPKSMVAVLFLDGHCDKMPAGDVEGADGAHGSRWRVLPKK